MKAIVFTDRKICRRSYGSCVTDGAQHRRRANRTGQQRGQSPRRKTQGEEDYPRRNRTPKIRFKRHCPAAGPIMGWLLVLDSRGVIAVSEDAWDRELETCLQMGYPATRLAIANRGCGLSLESRQDLPMRLLYLAMAVLVIFNLAGIEKAELPSNMKLGGLHWCSYQSLSKTGRPTVATAYG